MYLKGHGDDARGPVLLEFNMPSAIEPRGRLGKKALDLLHRICTLPEVLHRLQNRGYRTHDPGYRTHNTGKPYAIVLNMYKNSIMQRISTALMQGMTACIRDRLRHICRDRTAPEFRGLPMITPSDTR